MSSLIGKITRRHYYFTLNNNGINYIKDKLGITEQKVQPRTHALRAEALEPEQEDRPRGDRGDRGDRKGGFRSRGPREGAPRGAGFRGPRAEGGDAPAGAEGAEVNKIDQAAPVAEAM